MCPLQPLTDTKTRRVRYLAIKDCWSNVRSSLGYVYIAFIIVCCEFYLFYETGWRKPYKNRLTSTSTLDERTYERKHGLRVGMWDEMLRVTWKNKAIESLPIYTRVLNLLCLLTYFSCAWNIFDECVWPLTRLPISHLFIQSTALFALSKSMRLYVNKNEE